MQPHEQVLEGDALHLCNSGRPGSPHYADNVARWLALEYHPLLITWPEIEANAEGELLLTAAD